MSVPQNNNDAQDGGWEFWSRVYNDRELRNTIQETQAETRLSEILQSDSLCRAELVVGNVPRLSGSQGALVKQLIQRDLNCDVQILNIDIQNRKWIVKFYRLEDAQTVQRGMDGHFFRGKTLKATVTEIIVEEAEEEVQSGPSSLTAPVQNRSAAWTVVELNDFQKFKATATVIIAKHSSGVSFLDLLKELAPTRGSGLVSAVLESWPTAAFRMMAPEIKMTGFFLSTPEHYNIAQLMKRVLSQGGSRIELERWEPSFPFDIRNEAHLVEYAAALLSHFGPQHLDIDVPFRVFSSILNPEWPANPHELGQKLISLSVHFVIVGDILYLASNVRHRRLLLEYIQPASVVLKRNRDKKSRRSNEHNS